MKARYMPWNSSAVKTKTLTRLPLLDAVELEVQDEADAHGVLADQVQLFLSRQVVPGPDVPFGHVALH